METKCKYCSILIPKDAKTCPYCFKKQGNTALFTKDDNNFDRTLGHHAENKKKGPLAEIRRRDKTTITLGQIGVIIGAVLVFCSAASLLNRFSIPTLITGIGITVGILIAYVSRLVFIFVDIEKNTRITNELLSKYLSSKDNAAGGG